MADAAKSSRTRERNETITVKSVTKSLELLNCFTDEHPEWGVTAEVYVKNVFDEMPITDAFLNSDDSGLTTNIFTLDPRLVGVSVRKSF